MKLGWKFWKRNSKMEEPEPEREQRSGVGEGYTYSTTEDIREWIEKKVAEEGEAARPKQEFMEGQETLRRAQELREEDKEEKAQEKRRREDIRERLRVKGMEVSAEEAELEKRLREARGGSRLERFAKTTETLGRAGKGISKISGLGYKIATLGGPVKKPSREGIYGFTRSPLLDVTKPTAIIGMRALTTPHGRIPFTSSLALKESVMPSGLRGTLIGRAVMPTGIKSFPLRRIGTDPQHLQMLRRLAVPKGLTKVETEAYMEIRRNGDVDTPSHVVSELTKLGIPRQEAIDAIKGLLRKQVVKAGLKELEVIK